MTVDDAIRSVNELGVKASQEVAKPALDSMIKVVNTPADFLAKSTVRAVKISPLIAAGLAASDGYDGYGEAGNYIQRPTTSDKIASALANTATGLTLGFIPRREATVGLARLLADGREEASPAAESLQKEVNQEYLNKVRRNALNNLTGSSLR